MLPVKVLLTVICSKRVFVIVIKRKTFLSCFRKNIDYVLLKDFLADYFRLVVLSSSIAVLTVTLKRGVRPQIVSIDYSCSRYSIETISDV